MIPKRKFLRPKEPQNKSPLPSFETITFHLPETYECQISSKRRVFLYIFYSKDAKSALARLLKMEMQAHMHVLGLVPAFSLVIDIFINQDSISVFEVKKQVR
jgi:hypothetical protein